MTQPSPADANADPQTAAPGIHRAWPATLALWVPPLLWLALIYYVSDQPTLPRTTEPLLNRVLFGLAHALEYAVLAWLLWRPLTAKGTIKDWRRSAAILLLCALCALLDEYHQSFVPGRMADWVDVTTDTAGALLALLALRHPRVARAATWPDRQLTSR